MLRILELRSYAGARERIDAAKDKTDVPRSASVNLVFEVKALRLQRRNEERAAREAALHMAVT